MSYSWRMYGWSLVILIAICIFYGCAPRAADVSPLPKPAVSQPADLKPDAGDRERARYFKDLSERYAAEAVRFAKRADESETHARQMWFNIVGGLAIAAGLAAIILSFWYPLVGFLRLAGTAAIAAGVASIILAQVLPYLWVVALVALAAIVAAMVVNHGALKAAIGSWKDAAQRLPDTAKAAADEASLSLQTPTIRGHMTKLLRKF